VNFAISFLLLYGFIIFVHELGHYLAYRFYGFKPDLKFNSVAILIGENVMYLLTLKQFLIVGLSGVLAGLVPLLLFASPLGLWLLLYLIVCGIDLLSIVYIISNSKFKDVNMNTGKFFIKKSFEDIIKIRKQLKGK